MKTLGLTGGVGMGKSTCAQLLQARGAAVVDTDELARRVVEPGAPALAQVQSAFSPDIVDAGGRLKRELLAQRVFADSDARKKLEAILHPRIRALWQAQLETWRTEDRPLAVVVIPLLFETQAETAFDRVLCVACSTAAQYKRLRLRGWADEQIQQRISAQTPIEEKLLRSHYVIWTEGGMDIHVQQLERILTRLR